MTHNTAQPSRSSGPSDEIIFRAAEAIYERRVSVYSERTPDGLRGASKHVQESLLGDVKKMLEAVYGDIRREVLVEIAVGRNSFVRENGITDASRLHEAYAAAMDAVWATIRSTPAIEGKDEDNG